MYMYYVEQKAYLRKNKDTKAAFGTCRILLFLMQSKGVAYLRNIQYLN